MSDEALTLPTSVTAWLSDSAVRMSVNSILTIDEYDLPPGLLWQEMRTYHEARAVAQLTKAEWAIALLDLWNHIWGSQLSSDWLVRSPEEGDDWLTEGDLWEHSAITVSHRRGADVLFTAVELHHDRVVIAFGFEPENVDKFLVVGEPKPFIWGDGKKHDWENWNYITKGGNLIFQPGMLIDLRLAAGRAIELCLQRQG